MTSAASPWPEGVRPTPAFASALDFFATDARHLFVTGAAGTGKSTLLRCLRDLHSETAVVVAPTGLAAVNIGGQTIHSFFGLPPRLVVPTDIRRGRNGRLMRRMKLLIIDEVSMMRSDLMWAIDHTLRLNRGRPRDAFGGVRLALFGDLHQLPPVVREAEVGHDLEDRFGGPFFFSVSGLHEPPGTALLELSDAFRQKDAALLRTLNRIREGEADHTDIALLNARVSPIRRLSEGEPYVILTPTNAAADRINQAFLKALPEQARSYEAAISANFSASAYPTDSTLVLKPGAKVILLRNDADKRWVNGTPARIAKLADKRVWVEIDGKEIEIEPVAWENRVYAYDKDAEKLVESIAGTFTQFPVRLAWALTIHRSQGLTLDKVYLDLGRGAFAHGQTYVALSRCRSLEGLALARPLAPSDLRFDPAALGYRDRFDDITPRA